jgi:hypothetical protein
MSADGIGQSGPLGRVGRLVAKVFRVSFRSTEQQPIIEPEPAMVRRRDSASRRPTEQQGPKEDALIVIAILGASKHVTFGDAVREAKQSQDSRQRAPRIERQIAPPTERVTPPMETLPSQSMELMEMEE